MKFRLFLVGILLTSVSALADTYIVTSSSNLTTVVADGTCSVPAAGGACTFREAILESNADIDLDTIEFNIPNTDANLYHYRDNGVSSSLTLANQEPVSLGNPIDPDYPEAWFKIPLGSTAVVVNYPVTIDGFSQLGAVANTNEAFNISNTLNSINSILKIEFDGLDGSATRLFEFNKAGAFDSSGSTMKGVVVNNLRGSNLITVCQVPLSLDRDSGVNL